MLSLVTPLIEVLYAASLGDLPFSGVLAQSSEVLGFGVAGMVSQNATRGTDRCFAAHGIDAAICSEAEARHSLSMGIFTQRNPVMCAGEVYFREELIPTQQLEALPAYNEFVRPHELHEGATMCLNNTPGYAVLINFARPAHNADRNRQRQMMQLLAPHAVRAVRVGRALEHIAVLRQAHLDAINLSPYPVLIYDNLGRVFAVSHSAEQALVGDGLAIGCNGLRAAKESENQQLQQSVMRVVASTSKGLAALSSADLRITRPSGKRPFHVHCIPLPPTHFGDGAGLRPAAAVIVYDMDVPPTVPLQRIRSVFGLTGAEAIVAAGVMHGRSLHDIAEHQGNTVVTVRNLLKRIFAKTGAQRQSELCAMLLRAPLQIDLDALTQSAAKRLENPPQY